MLRFGRIGLRNIKTAISVAVCVFADFLLGVLFSALPYSESFFYELLRVFVIKNIFVYSCISAVVVMGSTLPDSKRYGLERIFGTLLGGLGGIIFLFIRENAIKLDTVIYPSGVILLIYFLTLVKKEELTPVTLTVFFITMINGDSGAHIYFIAKILATVFGTLISLAVNYAIKPGKGKRANI